MHKIIGLGSTGCGIAEEFSAYPEYLIYKIGSEIEERGNLALEKQTDIQGYEENTDIQEIQLYLRGIKEGDEVLFVVGGGEPISGLSLIILEQIKHAKINILYIVPDREIASDIQKRDDRIVFNILQEYTRSGLFEGIFLINKAVIEELVGDVTISSYEKSINNFIAYVVAMINYYDHTDTVLDNRSERHKLSRIGTFGVASLEKDAEVRYLFPLEKTQYVHYYYGIPAAELKEDNTLMREIKTQTKRFTQESVSTNFSVYSTTFNDVMVLCSLFTKEIQASSF